VLDGAGYHRSKDVVDKADELGYYAALFTRIQLKFKPNRTALESHE